MFQVTKRRLSPPCQSLVKAHRAIRLHNVLLPSVSVRVMPADADADANRKIFLSLKFSLLCSKFLLVLLIKHLFGAGWGILVRFKLRVILLTCSPLINFTGSVSEDLSYNSLSPRVMTLTPFLSIFLTSSIAVSMSAREILSKFSTMINEPAGITFDITLSNIRLNAAPSALCFW